MAIDEITESICEKIGGTSELRDFEDRFNSMKIYANLVYGLGIPKHYAQKYIKRYEQEIYKPLLEEYKRLNPEK